MKKPWITEMWLASIIVLPAIALWEILVRVFHVPIYLLPSPSRIFITLIENLGFYFEASALTLIEALSGLFLGLFAGVFGATLLGLWPRMERGVMTLAILVKSTPPYCHRPAADDMVGIWHHAKNHHHGVADLLPGSCECAQRVPFHRCRPPGHLPILARKPLGSLHQRARTLLVAPPFRCFEGHRSLGPDRRGGGRVDRRLGWIGTNNVACLYQS